MKIGILSGKGGTGKTTIATNLAYVLNPAILIDADVEEPNLSVFYGIDEQQKIVVEKSYPTINSETCKLCGKCGDFCRYNALLPTKKEVIVYKELCHDCGGCEIVCPTGSVTYNKRAIGEIIHGNILNKTHLYSGVLTVGELSGVAIISALNEIKHQEIILIDSPPGTSCATAEAIKTIDYAIVVTEATSFGLSDLMMVIELLDKKKIPYGVIINKLDSVDEAMTLYLNINNIQLLGEIPFEKKYALSYSKGELLAEKHSDYKLMIEGIIKRLPFECDHLEDGGTNE